MVHNYEEDYVPRPKYQSAKRATTTTILSSTWQSRKKDDNHIDISKDNDDDFIIESRTKYPTFHQSNQNNIESKTTSKAFQPPQQRKGLIRYVTEKNKKNT